MEYTTLGNTGLKVSVAGLGCGGHSRLGQGTGKTEDQSIAIVRQAVDMGVNFIDTARAYGTEAIVGKALKGLDCDALVISTKAQVRRDAIPKTAADVVADLEASLRDLQMEAVDVFHLHGVPPELYDHVVEEIVPVLERERDKGKFRFLGITETPPNDPSHLTLGRAVGAEVFKVVMIAFHMLNQKARNTVLDPARQAGIGTLIMFAVRVIFSRPERLRQAIAEQVAAGALPEWLAAKDEPLNFLIHPDGASSLTDAAYRYCRHTPGADVVLFGTGNVEHLKSNIDSILASKLPALDLEQIKQLFGKLEGVGLDRPAAS
jgi:L-galactose dehydrogenase